MNPPQKKKSELNGIIINIFGDYVFLLLQSNKMEGWRQCVVCGVFFIDASSPQLSMQVLQFSLHALNPTHQLRLIQLRGGRCFRRRRHLNTSTLRPTGEENRRRFWFWLDRVILWVVDSGDGWGTLQVLGCVGELLFVHLNLVLQFSDMVLVIGVDGGDDGARDVFWTCRNWRRGVRRGV